MVALNPITFAFIGLFIGLWIEGMAFLGAYPEQEGAAPVSPTLALGGFLLAGTTMLLGSLWLVLSTRVPAEGNPLALAQIPLLLSGILGVYGFVLLVAGIAQFNGWDLRPVGQMAIAAAILQAFMTPALVIALAAALGPSGLVTGLTIALVIFIVLLVGLFLLVNGKLGVKPVGAVCLLASLAALWVAVGFTGAVPML
jgi:cytochrome bd-type quinol oxidase subunit 2